MDLGGIRAYLKLIRTHPACIVSARLHQNPQQSAKDCLRVWLPLPKNLTAQSVHAEFWDRLLIIFRADIFEILRLVQCWQRVFLDMF